MTSLQNKADEKIQIVFYVNNRNGYFFLHLGTCITSIILNTKRKIVFNILHDATVSTSNLQRLNDFIKAKGHECVAIDFEQYISKLDTSSMDSLLNHCSSIVLGKLFLPQVLSCNRVLSLDADLVMDIDVGELWDWDLKGNPLGAVVDPCGMRALAIDSLDANQQHMVSLGIQLEKYMNAGVMLFDLAMLRNTEHLQNAFNFLMQNPSLLAADEASLTFAFQDSATVFPERYNYLQWAISSPVPETVWHFAGTKPWDGEHPFKERYLFYRERSPWKPAPIAFICFNRPAIVAQTLQALANAELAAQSDLHIFIDGPRNEQDVPDVEAVKNICTAENIREHFSTVTIHVSEYNIGCSKSVLNAFSVLCDASERMIVIEDDVLVSPFTLRYFNNALEKYRDSQKVFTIAGWRPPQLSVPDDYAYDAWFCPRGHVWGWATWSDRVRQVDWFAAGVAAFEKDAYLVEQFNRGGPDMAHMLSSTVRAPRFGWDILMDFSRFLKGGLCLVPTASYTMNIGMDSSSIGSSAVNLQGQRIDAAVPVPRLPNIVTEIETLTQAHYDAICHVNGMPPKYSKSPVTPQEALLQARNVLNGEFQKAETGFTSHLAYINQVWEWMGDAASKKLYAKEIAYKTLDCVVGNIRATDLYPCEMTHAEWTHAYNFTCQRTDLPNIVMPSGEAYPYVAYTTTFTLQQYQYKNEVQIEADDVFFDCGGYALDTSIWALQRGARRIVCFEPNPAFHEIMRKNKELNDPDDRIAIVPYGVSDAPNEFYFNNTGMGNSHIASSGNSVIQTLRLDDFCAENALYPTFIKMDVEGFEVNALMGAQNTIKTHKPKLAICLYHRPEHMWEVPFYIKQLVPEYRFYCKKSATQLETVLFAVV